MLNYLRILCTLAGCLSLLFVCPEGGIVITCPHAKTNVLQCERTLTSHVNAMLAPYSKSFNTIDLDNKTETELLDEKTRDVVCSKEQAESVSCMVGNITACPDLADDPDIASTWIASLIALHLDILNSHQRVCEFFQDSVCSFREARLSMCYNTIVGDVVTENTNVDMCVPAKRDDLTCILEMYRECMPYINLTNNENIATNIKVLMMEDRWNTFNTGSQLCDCYEGKACYTELNRSIIDAQTTVVSVRDEYQNTLALAEILCNNVTRVKCAQKGRSETCTNVLPNYNESSAIISLYDAAVDSICRTVRTKEFKNSKDCLVDKLTDSYHPCLQKAKVPANITVCRDFKKLYHCVKEALNGQCSGDYVVSVYEMIRTSIHNVLPCDVTSSASSLAKISVSAFMFTLYFVIYLCVI